MGVLIKEERRPHLRPRVFGSGGSFGGMIVSEGFMGVQKAAGVNTGF